MRQILVIAALIIATGGVATAEPTPIPGGANQAAGVEGTFGQELFNGEVRLVPKELRGAGPGENLTAAGGQKWLVFTATASNGMNAPLDMTQFNASIADAGGDTYQAQPDKVRPMGGLYGVPPAGRWKEEVYFNVPASFVPDKVVLLPYDRKHDAFRISVGSNGDAPASGGGTPSAAPTPAATSAASPAATAPGSASGC